MRAFFREREVLEVETPVLCRAGAVDEHLEPIPVRCRDGRSEERRLLYLVTSPEHSMKRLLAAGSGPIYQVTRAFRDGERGRLHNPEFTLLEWYRPGWDHHALMDEVEDLVRCVLDQDRGTAPDLREQARAPFERLSYRDAFKRALGIDPFTVSMRDLARVAVERGGAAEVTAKTPRDEDRDHLLNLLLAACVEPTLGFGSCTFVTDYPPTQAALARVRPADPPVAERFELYIRGVELSNGYHELTDPREQERRFREANVRRVGAGKPALPLDEAFLEALRAGMPSSAGVALGLDRLILLATGGRTLDDVLTFPVERA